LSYKARIVLKAVTMSLVAFAGVSLAIMGQWQAAALSLLLVLVGALKIKSLASRMRSE